MKESSKLITKDSKEFYKQTTMIKYSKEEQHTLTFDDIKDIVLKTEENEVIWLNTYGLDFKQEGRKIVKNNNLDRFLNTLMADNEHRNKVIELDDLLFLSIRTLHFKDDDFYWEQLLFVSSPDFVWSIQERKGDYFGAIRTRIANQKDIIRNKTAAYLLFAIIEAIIENYEDVYDKLNKNNLTGTRLIDVDPTPEFAETIENNKQQLFILKKGASSLRDAITKIEKTSLEKYEARYFTELKEQANYMIDDIDFDLQQLESTINLIFNVQSHKLNQVMKTLTVLSAIFIPLTFLVGVYGMNFDNMPELHFKYGYFISLGSMLLVSILIVFYFKKKKWF